jgi:hypothetical protein
MSTKCGWKAVGTPTHEAAPVYGAWDRTLSWVQWEAAAAADGKMSERQARAYVRELNEHAARAPLSTLSR